MLVIVTKNAPPALRGRLAVWLLEIRAGVYIGKYSRRVRDKLWSDINALIDEGSAIIAWDYPTDQGYNFKTIGKDRRTPVDLDGFKCVKFLPLETAEVELLELENVLVEN